jgi:hypothetical protein
MPALRYLANLLTEQPHPLASSLRPEGGHVGLGRKCLPWATPFSVILYDMGLAGTSDSSVADRRRMLGLPGYGVVVREDAATAGCRRDCRWSAVGSFSARLGSPLRVSVSIPRPMARPSLFFEPGGFAIVHVSSGAGIGCTQAPKTGSSRCPRQ